MNNRRNSAPSITTPADTVGHGYKNVRPVEGFRSVGPADTQGHGYRNVRPVEGYRKAGPADTQGHGVRHPAPAGVVEGFRGSVAEAYRG